MAADLEHIRAIAGRVAQSNGLELVDVEFRGGGKARMLRIYIDKPGGITHADCEAVSREVSAILDVEEAVPGGQYLLEVSSPGLDRKLVKPADYERFSGSRVKLQTRAPVYREPAGETRHLEGRLCGLRDGRVALELPPTKHAAGAQFEIELENIEKANLVPEF
jgi:ribosome maturation factor RimP